MAKRPTNVKKIRRLRKLMRQQLPAFIDLNEWLRTRGYAQTAGEADRIILAGRVRAESHTLGIREVDTPHGRMKIVAARVPARFRNALRVLPAASD